MSDPLRTIAIVCLLIGAASALITAVDLFAGHKQHMWIMNLVWPITGLYAGPLALWGYFTAGAALDLSRRAGSESARRRTARGKETVLANGRVR
jgi:hypothetical protein